MHSAKKQGNTLACSNTQNLSSGQLSGVHVFESIPLIQLVTLTWLMLALSILELNKWCHVPGWKHANSCYTDALIITTVCSILSYIYIIMYKSQWESHVGKQLIKTYILYCKSRDDPYLYYKSHKKFILCTATRTLQQASSKSVMASWPVPTNFALKNRAGLRVSTSRR